MSKYEVHNLARSMEVTESYIYTLVRRGIFKATQTRPVHIDADTVKEFYKDKIPTDLFELKHKNNINKISITSKPYVHINSSYFKMGGSKYASS